MTPLSAQVDRDVPLEPRMVADLSPGPGFNPDSIPFFVRSGSRVFFAATSARGRELWKLEANANTPQLVKDVLPGPDIGSVRVITDLDGNGTVVFAVRTAEHRFELWRSDGTSAGTRSVTVVLEPEAAIRAGNLVFLTDRDGGLWRSDGTAAGTFRLGSFPDAWGQWTDVNGTLFFGADELWKSDGTVGGTVLVRDLRSGGDSRPQSLISAGGLCYCLADDGSHYRVWRSDGTAAGTTSLFQDAGRYALFAPVAVGGTVFFGGDDGVNGRELWATDGTLAGTRLVIDLNPGPGDSNPQPLAALRGALLFAADGELWISLGFAAATARVLDKEPVQATVVGNTAFVWTYEGRGRYELHATDGTPAGTRLLQATTNHRWWSSVAQGNRLVFAFDDSVHGSEPWTSGGTPVSTNLLQDVNGAIGRSSDPMNLRSSAGQLFFTTADQLWRSDGSAAGTRPLGSDVGGWPLVEFRDQTFFVTKPSMDGHNDLWRTDGTAAGTVLVRAGGQASFVELVASDDALYFTEWVDRSSFRLWHGDGTSAGTVLVREGSPRGLTRLGDRLCFVDTDASHGRELWVSDGTPTGTTLLADIAPGAASSSPGGLQRAGDRLFFLADDQVHGSELWVSDGTANGTRLVRDLVADPRQPGPQLPLIAVGREVAFWIGGSGLWWSDGTAVGTRRVLALQFPGWRLHAAGRAVYFFVGSLLDGPVELWRSDGTVTGTRPLRSFFDVDLIHVGGGDSAGVGSGELFVFAASDGRGAGRELWAVRDGGAPFLVADLDPIGSSDPGGFMRVGDALFFAATTVEHGREPWVLDLAALGAVVIEPFGAGCIGRTGVPELTVEGLPKIGAGFALRIGDASASSAAAIVLAGDRARTAPACSWLLAGIQITLPLTTDVTGTATLRLTVPADRAFVGLDLYAQGVIADANGAFLGLASLTQGVHVLVGR